MAEFHRTRHLFACKLLHPIALSESQKVLVMDRTRRLSSSRTTDCVGEGWRQRGLYLHDSRDEAGSIPDQSELFASLNGESPTGRSWSLDHYYFNAESLAFAPSNLDLGIAENSSLTDNTPAEGTPQRRRSRLVQRMDPRAGRLHGDVRLNDPPAKPLGDEYRIGFQPGRTFCHFLRHYLVKSGDVAGPEPARPRAVTDEDRRSLLAFADDWGRHPSSCQHLIGQILDRREVLWVNTIRTGLRGSTWPPCVAASR